MTKNQPLRNITAARFCRWILCAAVVVTCLRVWVEPVAFNASASAQIPDSAKQRKQLLEAVQHTNRLLTDIKVHLEAGTLNVRLRSADNPSDSEGVPRRFAP